MPDNVPVFGTGVSWPPTVEAGRLTLSVEEETILDSVQAILESAKGSAPLDPNWGTANFGVFTTLSDLTAEGLVLAQDIQRSDPRITGLEVVFLSGPSEGDIIVTVTVQTIAGEYARTYPYYTAG